jgi:hypothetical protein
MQFILFPDCLQFKYFPKFNFNHFFQNEKLYLFPKMKFNYFPDFLL